MYSELLSYFGFRGRLHDDERTYIPSIRYESYDIENVKKFFSERKRNVRVFISNQETKSYQSTNFDFSPIIVDLANHFPDAEFFITNKNEYTSGVPVNKNVFFNEEIIATTGGDLNENSYLSLYCNIIVGRASGPYEFCKVKENLFSPDKVFICFSNNRSEAFWYMGNIEAKMVWSNVYDRDNIFSIISHEIREKQNNIERAA